LGVPEPVCAVGEFDWNVWRSFKPAQLRPEFEQLVHEIVTHRQRQKFVQNDPLVMPTHHPGCKFKYLTRLGSSGSDPIHDSIVEMQEGKVQLRNE
jgi:hypothetical protein